MGHNVRRKRAKLHYFILSLTFYNSEPNHHSHLEREILPKKALFNSPKTVTNMNFPAWLCPISPLSKGKRSMRLPTYDACIEQEKCSVCNAVDWQRCLLFLYPVFPPWMALLPLGSSLAFRQCLGDPRRNGKPCSSSKNG